MAEQPEQPDLHHAAVASFTLFALQSRTIMATVEEAVTFAANGVSARASALVRHDGPGRVTLVHALGPTGIRLGLSNRLFGGLGGLGLGGLRGGAATGTGDESLGGETFEVAPDLLTSPVSRRPLGLARLCCSLRVPGETPAPGEAAVLSVLVTVDGAPWGRLVVADRTPREFGRPEEVFLRRIAAVLGAAIERHQLERGHSALAAFGTFALRAPKLPTIIEAAIDAVRRVTETPAGAVVRVLAAPPGRPATLRVVQSQGLSGPAAGRDYDVDPALAEALDGAEPLIVEDWGTECRYASRVLPAEEESLSCLVVPLVVAGRPWGHLVVSDVRARVFSAREIELAASVAGVLAVALERHRPAAGPSVAGPSAGRPDVLFAGGGRGGPNPHTGSATEVALLNREGAIVWVNAAWLIFARENGGDPLRTGVGMSYLACCDAADDPVADDVGNAIRAAVAGDLPAPMRVLIPCHSPETARWFDVLVSSRYADDGTCLGAAVTLSLTVP